MDMKTGSDFKMSKINVNPYPNAKKAFEHYPCFCEVAELILFFARLFAITPIVRLKNNTHSQMCKFALSKYWKRYCYAVQVCFMVAAAIMHGIRLDCGPTISNTKFWYVMSIGYIINDLDAICCMIGGIIYGKRICNILEQIATISGSMQEMIALKSFMKKIILIIFLSYVISLCSYIYAGFLRADADVTFFDNHCNIPDYPFAVVFRGFGLIFPVIEHLILTFLCAIIENKFKQLMEKTDFTLALSTNFTDSSSTTPNSVGQLTHDHKQIWFCLKEINTCFGLQLLISTTSLLFTTIYFLYRYSISSRETVFSNTDERLHYIVGVLYRMANLLHYMYLGRQITFWVQTLLLQWSGKVGYLSASEVINMGPWLLAPIVGSVITYLLVALQFETTNRDAYNTTSMILEASF